MTPEQFRIAGHTLIDWIADHRLSVADRPVLAAVAPGEVAAGLGAQPPAATLSFEELMSEFETKIVPGVAELQNPMHFGWFASNASLSSILGDIACSGLGSIGISWQSSPALTEVEEVTCDWMRQLVGLSDSWTGAIHDTASTACLVALIAARERATGLSQNRGGLVSAESPVVIYSTDQAHSSIVKAALLAGFGWDNIRLIETDPATKAMLPADLAQAMALDIAAGRTPGAVVAAVGTTGTTAIDPVAEIVAAARSQAPAVWIHVDAAMAGSAMLVPECRHLWNGVEDSDSVSWNPHKWMGTILDCSLLYVRDPQELTSVMSTNPSYLQSAADGAVTQYRDWGIPLGRRFRSLKLWFQLQLDGVEAIQTRIRRDLANTQWLLAEIQQEPSWEVVAPVPLQTICVRHRPRNSAGELMAGEALDNHTLAWVGSINDSGKAYLTPSRLDDEWMVRIAIGVEGTERRHLTDVWTMMRQAVEQSG